MNFVVIGNGVAGTTACLVIRKREPQASITLISGESDYFFSRTALMYSYMDRLTLRDLEPFERKVYDGQAIRRIRDTVVDVDANAHLVRLKSGPAVAYDRLLIATGSAANIPLWDGLTSTTSGVVNFISLQDLAQCEALTPTTREAIVVGGGLIGIELVECLVHHGVKVTFLVREPWYWPAALDEEEAAMVTGHLRKHGIDLRLKEEVKTVLTIDGGRVRGIRTSLDNEIPGQMLGIAIGVHPAVDWLRGVLTPPELGRGILVDPAFRTSLDNVFAAGDCAEIGRDGERSLVEQIWYSAKRQGELAAYSMLGDPIDYRAPIFYNSSKLFEIEYTTVGVVVDRPADSTQFYYRVPGVEASIRVIARNDAVIGFNMLGSRWNHSYFERWISERRTLDYVMDFLPQAQFDVEFGRTNLSGALAAYRAGRRAA